MHLIFIFSSMKHGSSSVLLCGFGEGSVGTELNRMKMKIDAVEIDKRMKEIAQKYLYYNDSTTHFILDYARHYIKTTSKKYDLIVGCA